MHIFERARQIALVNSAGSILSWDQETYLPSGSAEYRSEQLSYLAAHAHELSTSPDYLKSLEDAESADDGTDTTLSANLRELRRESDRSVKIPTDLVARESTAQSAGHHAWIAARKEFRLLHLRSTPPEAPRFRPGKSRPLGLQGRAIRRPPRRLRTRHLHRRASPPFSKISKRNSPPSPPKP